MTVLIAVLAAAAVAMTVAYAAVDQTAPVTGPWEVLVVLGLLVVAASMLVVRFRAGHDVDSVTLVEAVLAPLLSKVVPSFPGVGSDIKKAGVTELAYARVPLKAFVSLRRAWPVVRADLARITCPVLVYRSRVDHVVEPVSGRALLAGLAGGTVEERVLENSYHVATLDNDAPTIFDGSLAFVRAHAPAAA